MRLLLAFALAIASARAGVTYVVESARRLPVAYDVDVLVIGGSTGAVAAAVAAAGGGAKVFLAAPRMYLGEDVCATMRLWLEPGEKPDTPLGKALFRPEGLMTEATEGPSRKGPYRPAHIKKTLDDALLRAGVSFLYGTYATGLLKDDAGRLAGAVIVNRSGRQAVQARVIIDATEYASFARMAGAETTPFPAGKQEFRRVVVGGPVREGEGVSGRKLGLAYRSRESSGANGSPNIRDIDAELIEYRLELDLPDSSYGSLMAAEHRGRELTYTDEIEADTDSLFHVPPFSVVTGQMGALHEWDVRNYQPRGVGQVYVLSGMAGLSRADAEALMRPLELIRAGDRIGAAAAAQAKLLPAAGQVTAGPVLSGDGPGDVQEILTGLRPSQEAQRFVDSPRMGVPVLGEFDVVVVGGGTGGVPASIAASESGATTLLLEFLHGLGGVGTLGRITQYWRGYRGGFTRGVGGGEDWNGVYKAEWWRQAAINAGVEVWFGATGCGAYVRDKTVLGVVVATPFGRGVILAKTVIDSTGNADVAAAAGAQVTRSGASEVAWQGTGVPAIRIGGGHHNTDFTITDETDALDSWNTLVYAKEKYKTEFDIGQLIDSRERRRVVGDFEMSVLDEMMSRRYPDTIAVAWTDYDTHGYTIEPYFLLEQPQRGENIMVNVPYRCLLPKGLNNILVTGLGISVQRDALPLVRMQADIQNHGYAAGLAAANAALRHSGDARAVDVKKLQRRLAQMEIVPESALTDKDSLPLPEDVIRQAVDGLRRNEMGSAAILLEHPETASPLLRQAWRDAKTPKDRLRFAIALSALNDTTGVDTLLEAVNDGTWDKGWKFQGMGQYGSSMSPIDKAIIALGRTKDPRAVAPIVRLMKELTDASEFSHYRAVGLALEAIASPEAAPALAEMLARPGIRGHVQRSPQDAIKQSGMSPKDESARSNSLRELAFARALYRCGDHKGQARRVLEEYQSDLRGHLAEHAKAVLAEH